MVARTPDRVNRGKPVDLSAFRHLYPFRSHYFRQPDGLLMHYLDEGRGDPIVMLHGNPTWSFYFRHLVTTLSPGGRTVVPDHLGCGLSDKPTASDYDFRLESRIRDLETLLDHLDIKRDITLVVHDWGGMIGMAYAVKHPGRIRRLVVLNTAAFFPPGNKGIPLRLRLIRDVAAFATPAVLGLNLFARGALFMAPGKRMTRAVRAGLIAPYNCPRNRLATLKFVQDIPLVPSDPGHDIVRDTMDSLQTLSHVPMLIAWGRKDFVFNVDYFNAWRSRFPEAEFHLFPNAGHYVLEDEPKAVSSLIVDFMERHPLHE